MGRQSTHSNGENSSESYTFDLYPDHAPTITSTIMEPNSVDNLSKSSCPSDGIYHVSECMIQPENKKETMSKRKMTLVLLSFIMILLTVSGMMVYKFIKTRNELQKSITIRNDLKSKLEIMEDINEAMRLENNDLLNKYEKLEKYYKILQQNKQDLENALSNSERRENEFEKCHSELKKSHDNLVMDYILLQEKNGNVENDLKVSKENEERFEDEVAKLMMGNTILSKTNKVLEGTVLKVEKELAEIQIAMKTEQALNAKLTDELQNTVSTFEEKLKEKQNTLEFQQDLIARLSSKKEELQIEKESMKRKLKALENQLCLKEKLVSDKDRLQHELEMRNFSEEALRLEYLKLEDKLQASTISRKKLEDDLQAILLERDKKIFQQQREIERLGTQIRPSNRNALCNPLQQLRRR